MSEPCSAFSVKSADDVSQAVREGACVLVRGGATKWCEPPAPTSEWSAGRRLAPLLLDTRQLSGITEYEPDEYTFTARAGTPLKEIIETLGREGQHLPFDPLFADEGATIGGTVATAMNGPARLRYGGVRDFIIGARFVDGEGRQLHGGGKVVKNAAGFDFPKLMTGSFGRLGVLTEVTFKVFPKPEARMTVAHDAGDLREAVDLVCRIARGPFDAEFIELLPPGRVIVGIAGHAAALRPRHDAMRVALGIAFDESGIPPAISRRSIKVPLVPSFVSILDAKLASTGTVRRYSVACNAASIEWPQDKSLSELDALLASMQLGGVALNSGRIWLGSRTGLDFLQRVKTALDPQNKLGALT
ncbi:MAG: FAD-binding protein [Verrucomicrobiaceae bacterium]|nr:FAD-binding protein [Verrucomicrobiaceae bacterium]